MPAQESRGAAGAMMCQTRIIRLRCSSVTSVRFCFHRVRLVQIRLQEPEGRIGSDRQRVKECSSSFHGRLLRFFLEGFLTCPVNMTFSFHNERNHPYFPLIDIGNYGYFLHRCERKMSYLKEIIICHPETGLHQARTRFEQFLFFSNKTFCTRPAARAIRGGFSGNCE